MQVQKGLVKYKDRSDIICTYGTTDDGKTYYFLDGEKLSNGYIIASSTLVEAIDPLVVASSIGVLDENGKIIVPFNNKSIKSINDRFLLVEVSQPTTQSVLDSINLRKDPLAATKLVTTSATIKEKIYTKMGTGGRFVFNDQFSEAMLCDLEGKNLFGDDKFSFIGVGENTIYLSKNTVDSPIVEYPLDDAKPEEKEENLGGDIDVKDALISKELIDSVMENKEANEVLPGAEKEKTPDSLDSEKNNNTDDIDADDKSSIIKPVIPNVISSDSDFPVGDQKSKMDDRELFSIFDDEPIIDTPKKDLKDVKLDIPTIKGEPVEEETFADNALFAEDESDYKADISAGDDNVFEDAVAIINKMIGQIEEQRKSIASYEDKISKLNELRNKSFEENKKLIHRYENLLQEYKKMEADINHKDEIIDNQKAEIATLMDQLANKKDLAKLLEKAQNLIDDDYSDNYTKVKSL